MANKILIMANSSSGLYDFRNELMTQILKNHQLLASIPPEDKSDQIAALGVRIIPTDIDRRGINPVTDAKLLLRYRKILKKEAPDLTITYTIKPNIYGGIACRMKKVPYAANITGLGTTFQKDGLLRKIVVSLYRIALKKARVVFFENAANRQVFIDMKIVPEQKCCLLNGAGINLERYISTPYPSAGVTRFLFIGRIMKEKGIEELFGAMERLTAEGERCVLDVVGEAEEDYSAQLSSYEQQGWLHYHGYQKDVRPFIEKAHCFTLPSYHEGMANTNLECAAMGRPVITSDVPGCREAVTTGSGLLCKPQNTDSLYKAMKTFLRLTPEARTQMGQVGRAHMEEVFDKKKVVRATMEALDL